jgi:hypothetical protein
MALRLFVNWSTYLTLLPVDDLWIQFLNSLEIESDRNNQAAEPLRNVLVQARESLNDQQRPHRHVDRHSEAILFLLEPTPGGQPSIDLPCDQQCLVGGLRLAYRSTFDAAASGRNYLG